MERPELPLTSKPRRIELHSEALPPLPLLECQWRRLEAVGNASFFTSWHWMGTLLAALPPTSRPKLLRGCANGATVALALLGADDTRRRHGLVRSRGLFVNETGDPRFDSLTIEHNGILAAAEWELSIWSELVSWFAGLHGEADELHIGGSLRRLPEAAIHRYGLGCQETSVPSYSVDLSRLQPSGGELYPVLSANARQQLRRAVRHFERFGALRLSEAANTAEAFSFFDAMKRLHCASWERRGKPHSFTGEFFEPFHRLLIERSFDAGGTQLLQVSAGDRVIGYLYNFRLGNRVYAYQSGFDDADSRERPGVVTHFLAIRHAFRSGAQVYDFMAGHNRLKASFATQCEPMLWQIVQQRRLAFRLEHLARRLKQTLVQSH
ncbi:MAG: GNAT family N-acetyltransferase [Alphaproteobacteria bacterium]|nr:GNAT family N-acetyltransferase [Alphaproteobacteria bacterium]